ncbi:MAG TPA: DUF559 domain-containing protein [Stellaceae bacterium]|jgi:hypothetical protein|nr:DUF559 domain-containing protein [Stellaceae bacterium]
MLRRNMSLPEVVLWQALRHGRLAGLRFRRQHPVGPYILDFFCASVRLAIEVDGLLGLKRIATSVARRGLSNAGLPCCVFLQKTFCEMKTWTGFFAVLKRRWPLPPPARYARHLPPSG